MLGKEASIHLIFSIIFNQSYKSEMAFKAPGELLKRLEKKSYDLNEIECNGVGVLHEAISAKPSLHRFPSNMAKYIYNSTKTINNEYNSDPRNIWRSQSDIEVINRLMRLSGIGEHKAIQCLIYLNVLEELVEIEEKYLEYMSMNCTNFFNNIEKDLQIIRLL